MIINDPLPKIKIMFRTSCTVQDCAREEERGDTLVTSYELVEMLVATLDTARS